MIKLWCFLILCFLASMLSGQTVFKGVVFSSNMEVLPGISLIVHAQKKSETIIAYAITDKNGVFLLQFEHPTDSIAITAKSLTHKDTTQWIANKSQKITFTLPLQYHSIKEVSIEGHPISAKGDTITYNVNSFARMKDRSIGDVISKMPGFEVDELGKIFYQRQPIQKYYIEGLDLLEKRYGIANRNLPHQSVSSVEVLQNHQPIKMLESIIASNETSLNIKLKNNVAITGTMYTGSGFSPFLRDINLTPMLFQKKQQIIASWQSNNIGDDLNTQHQPLEFSMGELKGINNRKPELTGISSISQPQIETNRYLDNNANLLTYNHLLKINPITELKINSSYYHDLIGERGKITTSYFLSGQTYTINENTINNYYKKSFTTNFTLTQNEKNRYIKNITSINRFWDNEEGLIQSDINIIQKAQTPHFSLANELDVLLQIKRNFIRFYSLVDYNNSPQELSVTPGVFKEELNGGKNYSLTTQNYSINNIVSHHYLQFSLAQKPWVLETEPGIKYEKQHLKTFVKTDDTVLLADSLNNQLDWNYSELYLTEKLRFEKNEFRARLELPFRAIVYHIDDQYHNIPDKIQKLFFTPSFYLKFDLNSYLSARISAKYTSLLGNANQLTKGYILSNYRHMKRLPEKLSQKNGIRYSLGLEYNNPISGFFSTFLWFGNRTTHNLLLHQKINQNGLLYYDAITQDNQSRSNNFSVKLSQFLSGLHTTIDLKSNYNFTKKEYLFNNTKGWLTNRVFILHPGLTINRWRFIDLEYSYQFQLFRQNTIQANTSVFEQKHKGSIFITPSKKHLVGINCEYYKTKQKDRNNFNVFFANLTYHYKPKKGKIQYKLQVNNLFNHSEIIRYYNSDISLVRTSYQIRPRQLIATISIGL